MKHERKCTEVAISVHTKRDVNDIETRIEEIRY